MQHSLETIGGPSYISSRALKNPQSSRPFYPTSGGYTLKVRGPGGPVPRALRPRPVCPARGSGAGRRLGGGSAPSFSGRDAAEPKVAGGRRRGEEEGGRRGRGRGSERKAGNARGAGPQSCPVAETRRWLSVLLPSSISGRMCSRGCGCSAQRQRALRPQAAAQVQAAHIWRGAGRGRGAGSVWGLARRGVRVIHTKGAPWLD